MVSVEVVGGIILGLVLRVGEGGIAKRIEEVTNERDTKIKEVFNKSPFRLKDTKSPVYKSVI